MSIPNLVSTELFEDELRAGVRAGGYRSKKAAVRHALEVLLAANPDLRLRTALELYRQDKITLLRAAEIASLDIEAFKEILAQHNTPIRVDEALEDVRMGADLIHRLRRKP